MTRRITIVDVAKEAGVSISSVSSAMNGRNEVSEVTRRRIMAVADDMGWVPSVRGRSLSGKRAFAVGLMVQRPPDILSADPFFAGFISGVEKVLEPRGQALVLQMTSSARSSQDRYRQFAREHRVDGVFLDGIVVDDPRIKLLAKLKMPAVAINTSNDERRFPAVRQDYRHGIEQVVAHLLDLGHRHIAHVSGASEFVHSRQRQQAWELGLRGAGVEPGHVFAGDFTFLSGMAAADSLLAGKSRPTAVVCANDLMAIGFIARAADLGLNVPGDVSVTGYDGNEMGNFLRPSLTTVRTSPSLIGQEAASLLLDVIDGKEVSDVTIEPAELVVRQSTAPVSG